MVVIKLFNYKENNYNSNGIAVIHPISQMEYKETSLNGWHIEAEVPIKYKDIVKEGMVALVDTKSKGPQPFIISNITKTHDGLHFIANHYVFDATNYVLEDVRPTNMSAAGALKYVNERTDIKSPFTVNSNVSNVNTAYFVNKTLLEGLDTIQERWGGVYDVDKFHINLRDKVGVDRGDTIQYGKNLEGLKVFEDWSNVVTKLLPVGFDGITLPETYLYSELDYNKPYTKIVRFETDLEDDERTESALIEELRAKATEYLKENEVPKISYEIESNINQKLEIGDIIHVKHPVVDIVTEVIAYEYNMLTERITKLTFGNYKRSVKKKVDTIKESIKELSEKTNGFRKIIENQSDLINNMNKLGHIYIDDNQIMILDKLPKENAKYVWRWNLAGLAFSETGFEGPFKQAWTIDGTFNTDFISAGSIMANHLSADVGSSLDLTSNTGIHLIVDDKVKVVDTKVKDVNDRVTTIDSEIDDINEEVVNKVDRDKIITAINLSSESAHISAEKISLEGHITANGGFEIDKNGGMKATIGRIGSFNILDGNLYSTVNSWIDVGDGMNLARLARKNNALTLISKGDFDLEQSNYLPTTSFGMRFNSSNSDHSSKRLSFIEVSERDQSPFSWLYVKGNFDSIEPNTWVDEEKYIGRSYNRYSVVFLERQPNISSDSRKKYATQSIPKGLLEEISKVEPKMYLQNKTWHFGYIAQDIERALYKWATQEFGRDAKHYVDKFAFLHKDESYMSLLYGEIAVLKEKAMTDRINKLENELEELKEMLMKGEYK